MSLFVIPLFVPDSFAGEERDIICHSGPGMYAKYRQTRLHRGLTIHFKRQNISHANKKVPPGYCSFPLAGMGSDSPDKLYYSQDNQRSTLLALHISPTTLNVDYQAFVNGVGLDPRTEAMMKMMHTHRRYIIKAVRKKIDGPIGWVWFVKSIGWNNTL
jgi:hypothetical protein